MRSIVIILLVVTCLAAKQSTLRMKTYEVITEAQTLMDGAQYAKAKAALDAYAPNVANRPFDRAYLKTVYGHLYIAQEQYQKAIGVMREAYDAHALNTEMQRNLLFNLAQLYLSIEDYEQCVKTYERWASEARSIKAEQYMLYANALIPLKQYAEAKRAVLHAINVSDTPVASHYQTLFYLQYELQEYDAGIETVKKLILLFEPKKQYWMQLAGLYTQQNRYGDALAVMEIAYREGMLDKEYERLQLAQLYLYEAIPYRAAEVVEQGMKEELIARSVKNLEMLGNCYYRAHAFERAVQSYARAAELGSDGRLYFFLAKLYADTYHYDKVIDAAQKALEKGVANTGEVYFLQGMALYENDEPLLAQKAFEQARKYPKTAKQAAQWILYLTQ